MSEQTRRVLVRGATKACPNCGSRKIFKRYFRILERCPKCGYEFAREEGYWTGALIINMALTELLFLAVFIAYVVVTIPDVRWGTLLAIAAITNVVFPTLFYPWSKTVWMAVDLVFMKKLDF